MTSSAYRILTVDVATPEWAEIYDATDKGSRNDGIYWNMSSGRWNDAYNKFLSVHGDLYLGVDLVSFNTSHDLSGSNLTETISNYLAFNATGEQDCVRYLTRESQVWLTYTLGRADNSTDQDEAQRFCEIEPNEALQRAHISVHIKQAASEKRKGRPSSVRVSL